jgi:hypothetical protein
MGFQMAVVSVERKLDTGGGYDDEYNRDYQTVYEVITDSENDEVITVEFASGVPRVGDVYVGRDSTTDVLARCRKVNARRSLDDTQLWIVTCDFSNAPARNGVGGAASGKQPGNDTDPVNRRPRIWWDYEQVKIPFRRAIGGAWVQNTAGDPFDPLPEIDGVVPVYNVERYEAVFNPAIAKNYAYAVNSGAFMFAAAGQAQLLPVPASYEDAGGGLLRWKVHYRVRFAVDWPTTWQPRLLNAGYRWKPLGSTVAQAVRDPISQEPVSRPVPLDINGIPIPAATLIASGPLYLDFTGYGQIDFDDLNLIY